MQIRVQHSIYAAYWQYGAENSVPNSTSPPHSSHFMIFPHLWTVCIIQSGWSKQMEISTRNVIGIHQIPEVWRQSAATLLLHFNLKVYVHQCMAFAGFGMSCGTHHRSSVPLLRCPSNWAFERNMFCLMSAVLECISSGFGFFQYERAATAFIPLEAGLRLWIREVWVLDSLRFQIQSRIIESYMCYCNI